MVNNTQSTHSICSDSYRLRMHRTTETSSPFISVPPRTKPRRSTPPASRSILSLAMPSYGACTLRTCSPVLSQFITFNWMYDRFEYGDYNAANQTGEGEPFVQMVSTVDPSGAKNEYRDFVQKIQNFRTLQPSEFVAKQLSGSN